jgi:flavin reductase (DIM6/NTAB) family NADH-FMN oxidoreductase RutF
METFPESLPWRSVYKLLIGSVVPRPIGWISTLGPDGSPNLAPFSFFNVVCPNPPHVMFCPEVRSSDGALKDTLRNVRANGEFVVNIVTRELAEAMNLTSQELPPEVDEFAVANLIASPSLVVRPPRVAQSPIHFECRVAQIIELGSGPGGGSLVLGRVVHLHVDESVLIGTDKIDLEKLKPIGRLAGSGYCQVSETFTMDRPPSKLSGILAE